MDPKIKFKINNQFNAELKKEWAYLTDLCHISVFQSYPWQLAWFENINATVSRNSVTIISVYFNNNVVAIIPFEKKNFLSLNILSLTGFPFADYCDCLIDKMFFASNPKIKHEIVKYILNIDNIDLIKIQNIFEDNNIHNLFNKYEFNKSPFSSYQLYHKNDYEEIIPKKFINDTKRQIRRLKTLGKLSFYIANSDYQKNEIFNFFIKHKKEQLINTNNWNYLNNKDYINFLKRIYIADQNHLSCITLNKKIIAVHMGNLFNKKMFYLFPAYDSSYSKYSPGNILIYELIKILTLQKYKDLDFTTGDESYKLKLSNYRTNILYKNIYLTAKGRFYSIILSFLSIFKKNYYFKLLYNKIIYR